MKASDYEYCPHCKGRFSFRKPVEKDGRVECPFCEEIIINKLGLTEEELDQLFGAKNTHEMAKILLKMDPIEMVDQGRDGLTFDIWDGEDPIGNGGIYRI